MEDASRNTTKHHRKRKDKASASSSSTRPKAIWDSRTHDLFINLCIDEVRAGNMPTSYFTKKGWENILQRFNAATGRDYNRSQLKNHWDVMKKEWQAWRKLIGNEIGLGQDHEKQIIDADDDWWEAKIKTQPELAKFREKGLEHRDKYAELFRDVTATGAWALSSGCPPKNLTQGTNSSQRSSCGGDLSAANDADAIDDDKHIEGAIVPLDNITPAVGTSPVLECSKKKATESMSTRGKGKYGTGAARFTSQIHRLVEVVESKSTTTSLIGGQEKTSIPAVFDALANLPGVKIGDVLYMLGTRLFAKQENREIFTVLPTDEVKLQWLRQELHRESAAGASLSRVTGPGI